MGSIVKHQKGWRAHIARHGARSSKLFTSKTAAKDWITQNETRILEGDFQRKTTKTVGDLLARYLEEVSVTKRGHRWELLRISLLRRDGIGRVSLSDLSSADIASWRDRRLKVVSGASVLRDWTLLSAAFNVAKNEWGWIKQNPMQGVKRPKTPKSRDRLISEEEKQLLLDELQYIDCPNTSRSRSAAAFLFALETGMRAGEIAGIKPEDVKLKNRVCHLPQTKNGTSRDVPLSAEAVRILKQVGCDFNLNSNLLSKYFSNATREVGIENLHFHDTRHQAITNLARKLNVLELTRMVGIRDTKILMVYYNETAEEIAKKL